MSFYLAYLFLAIKSAPSQQIKKILVDLVLPDSNLDTETKSITVDQKLFQGFKGYNSLKKSELEVKQADFKLKQTEQQTIVENSICLFRFCIQISKRRI